MLIYLVLVENFKKILKINLVHSDNKRVTGLHNSYPRVITSSQFGSNEYVF